MIRLPILYSFRRCPYAMRARLAVLASGCTVEIREVKLRDKPAAMIAASPKGTVPVLVLPGGQVIDQSIDIMRHMLTIGDSEDWLARDDAALIDANDGSFKHHLDRYKYPERHGSDPAVHRDSALALLRPLDDRLASHAQLCGDRPGLTDMALFPFVRQYGAVDPAWFAAQDVPHVRRWLAGHLASALFDRAMIRLSPWQGGDAPLLFGAP
ncbi:MAG: glutathione S-transferase [Sphingobium sp.]